MPIAASAKCTRKARRPSRADRRDETEVRPWEARTSEVRRAKDRHPLAEPSLFYDPPYANRVHDRLAWQLVRHLAPTCALQYRTVALTPEDCFRVDFLIEQETPDDGTRRVALLCSEEANAPHLRDALMVGAGAADVLYRFRPEDLWRCLDDILFLMAKWNPLLFDESARVRLAGKASAEAQRMLARPGRPELRLTYAPKPVDVQPGEVPERPAAPSELVIRRLSRKHPNAWQSAFRRARAHFDSSAARAQGHPPRMRRA